VNRTVCSEIWEFTRQEGKVHPQFCKKDGRWVQVETGDKLIQILGLGLRGLGVEKGVPVAILSWTRFEWVFLDMATLSVGGIVVGIHDSLPTEDVRYIIEHSESRVVVLENGEMFQKHGRAILDCPQVEYVVVIDPCELPGDERILTYSDLVPRGKQAQQADPDLFGRLVDQVQPEDVATYMYTSGTTGRSKAVILTHKNLFESAKAMRRIMPLTESDVSLIFLPLSHVLQRMSLYVGADGTCGTAYYAESIEKLVENIAEVQPTVMVCVPRIFEKIHARVMEKVEALSPVRRAIFNHFLEVGIRVAELRRKGLPVPPLLAIRYRIAYRLSLYRVNQVLGGRTKYLASGGAPLAPEIAEFFNACGVVVLEGYGLSETSSAASVNRYENFRFGTVGKPLPGTQIRIAPDGEILIKGPGVFSGYLKDEAETRAAITDGWFRTGDVGHLQADGFLVITDRKKDLIVTSQGKNIAPQKIENLLKQDPLISQVMVHGDQRKFLTALITLDAEEVLLYAERQGITDRDPARLAVHPRIQQEIERIVFKVNSRLPRFETIKKYRVLDGDFTVEGGELTPTLKVKRKVVEKRYAEVLDSFYG
jgi:long-chain acyl-CoA synthetase